MTLMSKDEAKRAFLDSGCSTFTMARENLPLYERYLALGIDKETELSWRKERFYEILNSPRQPSYWKRIDKLIELAQSIKQIKFFHEIYIELNKIQPTLEDFERVIIAETLIGRLSVTERSGVIFMTYDLGDKQLSSKFVELTSNLLAFETEENDLLVRIDNAKKSLEDIVREL